MGVTVAVGADDCAVTGGGVAGGGRVMYVSAMIAAITTSRPSLIRDARRCALLRPPGSGAVPRKLIAT